MTRKKPRNRWREKEVRPTGPPDSVTLHESYSELVDYLCKPCENPRGVQLPDGRVWEIAAGEGLTEMQRDELLQVLADYGLVPSN